MSLTVPNKIFNCGYCGKLYSRKSSYERHVLCCEILSQPQRERQLKVQDLDGTPEITKLYQIIQELVHKQAKQTKEIDKLKQFVNKTKKQLNIIDWLNDNCNKTLTFDKFITNIELERRHLEYVFKYDFIDGMMYIFQELFPLSDELPIRCFDQKPGTFFIVKNDNWVVMTALELENMLNTINRMIIKEFGQWQTDNIDKIVKDERFNDIYNENVIKVLGTKRPHDVTFTRIKNRLYKYLKFNLKRIIQFEFN